MKFHYKGYRFVNDCWGLLNLQTRKHFWIFDYWSTEYFSNIRVGDKNPDELKSDFDFIIKMYEGKLEREAERKRLFAEQTDFVIE